MSLAIAIIGGVLQLVALGLTVNVWRRPGRLVTKLFWTAVVLVPFLGVVAFAVWHEPPPPSDPVDRPPSRDWDYPQG